MDAVKLTELSQKFSMSNHPPKLFGDFLKDIFLWNVLDPSNTSGLPLLLEILPSDLIHLPPQLEALPPPDWPAAF